MATYLLLKEGVKAKDLEANFPSCLKMTHPSWGVSVENDGNELQEVVLAAKTGYAESSIALVLLLYKINI